MNSNTPLSEAAVWSLPLWGRGGIDKVPLCKVIMGDERQGSLTLPRLFMLPSIQSIPVYGFLFHPTKITSWGKNVQEYGVKTIKSVENKYLWSTFLVEVLVCLDEADRQIKPLEMSDVRQLTPAACILVTLPYRSATVWSATKVVLYCRKSKCFPFICAFTEHLLTSHLCSMVIAH